MAVGAEKAVTVEWFLIIRGARRARKTVAAVVRKDAGRRMLMEQSRGGNGYRRVATLKQHLECLVIIPESIQRLATDWGVCRAKVCIA